MKKFRDWADSGPLQMAGEGNDGQAVSPTLTLHFHLALLGLLLV